jgi:hypothetical protein
VRGAMRPRPFRSHIVWRRGLDVEPIDVHDRHATRWLLACVWADHPVRRQRLMAAIELARASPPVVVRGDLGDDLSSLVDDAPPDARLVVLHSAVFPYVPPERRAAFAKTLAHISARREVVWISNEAEGIVSTLKTDAQARAADRHLPTERTVRSRANNAASRCRSRRSPGCCTPTRGRNDVARRDGLTSKWRQR